MSQLSKAVLLEADNSILEKNLKFVKNEMEDELKQILGGGKQTAVNANRDYKIVSPKPGFCIKSFKVNTNEKHFINVCQTEEVPAPENINEEKLTQILQSDMPGSFRIPMSISDPRVTKDKKNNPVDVCDIAINPQFFAKIEKSMLFKDFFLALIAEALSEKYNVQIKTDKFIILNNRKFIGTLVSHRIRNTDIKSALIPHDNNTRDNAYMKKKVEDSDIGMPKVLVEEITQNEINELKSNASTKTALKVKKETLNKIGIEPVFKLRAKLKGEAVEEIQAEFYLPKCISSQEINLDIGEDRILLEATKHGYLFDKFVNYQFDQEKVNAIFDKTSKMLQVRVPALPVQ